MSEYQNIETSIVALFILIVFIFLYKYIYPKKNISYFVLLMLLALLPLVSLLRPGAYESGDFNIHIYRAIAFYNNLAEGNLMPSWAGNLNSEYGYPLYIFLNPLPYYVLSLLYTFGFSMITSMKIYLGVLYISSGIGMYLLSKLIFKNKFLGFTSGILYLFFPYRFIDLHFRATVGENTFFAIYPFYLISLYLLLKRPNYKNALISSLILGLLFMGHQAMALFSFIVTIPYVIFFLDREVVIRKQFKYFFISILLGFVSVSYILFSQIFYTKYTFANIVASQSVSYPNFLNLIYSPWKYGFLFQGPNGELSFIIGYVQIILFFIGIYLIIKKDRLHLDRKPLIFWSCLSLFIVFLILNISKFIWDVTPLIKTAALSTRLLGLLAVTQAINLTYVLKNFKNKTYVFILLLILVLTTVFNWGHRRVIPDINDSLLVESLPSSTYKGEGLTLLATPKWSDPNLFWIEHPPKYRLQVLKGSAAITQIKTNTTYHRYNVVVTSNSATIVENTLFFPGWLINVDGKSIPISVYKNHEIGAMEFSLNKGNHVIEVRYEDLYIYKAFKLFSIIFIVATLIQLIYIYKNNQESK